MIHKKLNHLMQTEKFVQVGETGQITPLSPDDPDIKSKMIGPSINAVIKQKIEEHPIALAHVLSVCIVGPTNDSPMLYAVAPDDRLSIDLLAQLLHLPTLGTIMFDFTTPVATNCAMIHVKDHGTVIQMASIVSAKKVCNFCTRVVKQDTTLAKCASCRQARYCDAKCQQNHWSKHKAYCKKHTAANGKIALEVVE